LSDDPTEFLDEKIETGFVTATVNPSEEPSGQAIVSEPAAEAESEELTNEEVQAVKALVGAPDISTVALAQLAREIAQDIGLLPDILAKYKLTQAQYEHLCKHNKFFKSALKQEAKVWQGAASTEARVRMQALAALEQQMPVIANRMGNAAEKLGDAVEAFKVVAKIAGVDTPTTGPVTTGERYQIVIDLGAGSDLVIAAKGRAAESAEPAGTKTISSDG
jgi:hypothetical protein